MNSNATRIAGALAGLLGMAALAAPLAAHDTPNMKHTHAFEQTGYGKVRQGHTVDNELGSITIWSAKPQQGYPASPPVDFARPEPITRAPSLPQIGPAKARPAPAYGVPKKDYGKPKRD